MTTQKVVIRDETNADIGVITQVTVAAFATMEISGHTEQFIIEALRSAGALTLSLVAELDGRVVGHIAFSPVAISDGTKDWYGLGPVSVLPEYQRRGIGKALIKEGLSRLKKLSAIGLLPETWTAGISCFGIATGLVSAVLWKPLKKMQNNSTPPQKQTSDLIGYEFVLQQDVTTLQTGQHRYSGVDWKVELDGQAGAQLSAGQRVTVTSIDAGIFRVKSV